ncbi:MAG TPA: serine/threonine-protein kinase [Kofleriaceae bacterium]|nr:serine/threonine-protein kinase [Kofleriaceae bacterium]
MLWRLMFAAYAALGVFLAIAYWQYPGSAPRLQAYVYGAFTVGLAVMGTQYLVILRRPFLSMRTLQGLDTFYVIASLSIISFCAMVSLDRRQAAYSCLIYSCFAVLTRALIVPSTGRRTAIVTTLGYIPMTIGALFLAKYANWRPGKDVPPVGFIIGFVQIVFVAIVLSAAGSELIYGLRRKVSAAQLLGKYTLVQKIGEGGMGVVYLAHHLLLRRPTAVKVLQPDRVGAENLQRFEREVHHMSQLTHPNTVAIYDYGHSPDGVFYYAMEYLGGGIDLQNLVLKHGKQPAERVRQILMQACGALQEAHDRGIVHRDIKPANIILCERGELPDVVKVVDFGLVKELSSDSSQSQAMIMGTPGYVAPEVVTDPDALGPAVDIYALGAVAYYLLTGRRVFDGKNVLEVSLQHVTKEPTPPSQVAAVHVPRALEELIMQCLEKTPSKRPTSANALFEALRDMGSLDDWDESRAVAWWKSYAAKPAIDATSTPTRTITVDIGHRSVKHKVPA